MLRKSIPTLLQITSRLSKPYVTGNRALSRCYCNKGPCRHLPISRRSPFDQFFGEGGISWPAKMMDQQMKLMQNVMNEFISRRPWWEMGESGTPFTRYGKEMQVKHGDGMFEVHLNTSGYAPEELQVKLVGDELTINAKHSRKTEKYGTIAKEFTRQFTVPKDVELDTMESLLTGEGHLVIKAKLKAGESGTDRVINIERGEPSEQPDK